MYIVNESGRLVFIRKMRELLKEFVNEKKVLILGFGREGKSSYKLIKEVGGYESLDIADKNPIDESLTQGSKLIIGDGYLQCLNEYDIVMKSPGIVLDKPVDEYRAIISSQVDLFLKRYGCQAVGITGTKGKSTTSTLLYHVLKEANKDVMLAGNIGIPVFDIIDEINETTTLVLELSCHQLEFSHYSTHRAIFLNLYEDHLDHYGTFEKYCAAKKKLYINQTREDILYCNPDFLPEDGSCLARVEKVYADILPFKDLKELSGVSLKGKHNLINVAFVYSVCKEFGITDECFKKAVASYKTLDHRLEYIGTLNGVEYYDDSISTTVESAISAMEAISNIGIILLGGMDRGIDYDKLVDYLLKKPLDDIILMYDSGKVIYEKLNGTDIFENVKYIQTLGEACEYAKLNAKAGKAVVLSPAAASYGVFLNFEERGKAFKKYVFGEQVE